MKQVQGRQSATTQDWRTTKSRLFIFIWLLMIVLGSSSLFLLFWLYPWSKPVYWNFQLQGTSEHRSRNPFQANDQKKMTELDCFSSKHFSSIPVSRDEARKQFRELKRLSRNRSIILDITANVCSTEQGILILYSNSQNKDSERNSLDLAELLEWCIQDREKSHLLICQLDHIKCEEQQFFQSIQELQSLYPNLHILISMHPGQSPSTSGFLQQSIFRHYIYQGVRGSCDGWNDDFLIDSRVSVSELARYTQHKTNRWARENEANDQLPIYFPGQEDFYLCRANLPDEEEQEFSSKQAIPGQLDELYKKINNSEIDQISKYEILRQLVQVEQQWLSDFDSSRLLEALVTIEAKLSSIIQNGPIVRQRLENHLDQSYLNTPKFIELKKQIRTTLQRLKELKQESKETTSTNIILESPFVATLSSSELLTVCNHIIEQERLNVIQLEWLQNLLQSKSVSTLETDLLKDIILILKKNQNADLLDHGLNLYRLFCLNQRLTKDREVYPWVKDLLSKTEEFFKEAQFSFLHHDAVAPEILKRQLQKASSQSTTIYSFAVAYQSAIKEWDCLVQHQEDYYRCTHAGLIEGDIYSKLLLSGKSIEKLLDPTNVEPSQSDLPNLVDTWDSYSKDLQFGRVLLESIFKPSAIEAIRLSLTRLKSTDTTYLQANAILQSVLPPFESRSLLRMSFYEYKYNRALLSFSRDTDESWNISRRLQFAPKNNFLEVEKPLFQQHKFKTIAKVVNQSWQRFQIQRLMWYQQYGSFSLQNLQKEYDSIYPNAASIQEPYPVEIQPLPPIMLTRNQQTYMVKVPIKNLSTSDKLSLSCQLDSPDPDWIQSSPIISESLNPLEKKLVFLPFQLGTNAANISQYSGLILKVQCNSETYHFYQPVDTTLYISRFRLQAQTSLDSAPSAIKEISLRPNGTTWQGTLFINNDSAKSQSILIKCSSLNINQEMIIPAQSALPLKSSFKKSDVPSKSDSISSDSVLLQNIIEFQILQSKSNILLDTLILPIRVQHPSEYITISQARLVPNLSLNQFRIEILTQSISSMNTKIMSKIYLSSASELPSYVSGKQQIATLEPIHRGTFLYLDAIPYEQLQSNLRLFVDLDTFPRAFEYQLDSTQPKNPISLLRSTKPRIHVRSANVASTTKPLSVFLEPSQALPGMTLEFELGSMIEGEFKAEYRKILEHPYRYEYRSKSNEDGSLQFAATVHDHELAVPLQQVAGQRIMRSRLYNAEHKLIDEFTKQVIIDDVGPANIRFLNAPMQATLGQKISITVTSDISFAGIEKVRLYYGEPKDKQPPTNAISVQADASDAANTVWRGVLPPPETKTEVFITAEFTSKANQVATKTIRLPIASQDEVAQSKFATITGRILEADRPQANLTVRLLDEKGIEKAQTKSTATGEYMFVQVPPGSYRLISQKPSTNRLANRSVKLSPQQNLTADLLLYLQ